MQNQTSENVVSEAYFWGERQCMGISIGRSGVGCVFFRQYLCASQVYLQSQTDSQDELADTADEPTQKRIEGKVSHEQSINKLQNSQQH